MDTGEAGIVVAFVVSVGLHLLVSLALWAWGRRVARRHGGGAWKLLPWAPLAALGLLVLGGTASTVLLIRGFRDVASVDVANKAPFLAQSISEAMNWGALFTLPALALYVATVVALIVGSLKAAPAPSSS